MSRAMEISFGVTVSIEAPVRRPITTPTRVLFDPSSPPYIGHIIVLPDGTFDTDDMNSFAATVTVTAGAYTESSLISLVQPQLPSADWIVSVLDGLVSFFNPKSTIDITWTSTTIRDLLGFSHDAVNFDCINLGPFMADRAVF